jgi:hypothetical protein
VKLRKNSWDKRHYDDHLWKCNLYKISHIRFYSRKFKNEKQNKPKISRLQKVIKGRNKCTEKLKAQNFIVWKNNSKINNSLALPKRKERTDFIFQFYI